MNQHALKAEVRAARQLALSLGLVMWGLGAAVGVWVGVRSPLVDAYTVIGSLLVSGVMLAASVAGIGLGWDFAAVRRRHTRDPMAEAWSALTIYLLFPALTTFWVLRDAGLFDWEEHRLATPVMFAAILFIRGAMMFSPVGDRLLAVETRSRLHAETARWLAPATGVAYLLAAAVTFTTIAAGRDWLAFSTALIGFAAIQAGFVLVGRRARRSARAGPVDAHASGQAQPRP